MADEIRKLQKMLRMIAVQTEEIPAVIPDGIYGAQTEEAVRAFQREAGLPETGCTDAETWARILEAYSVLLPGAGERATENPAFLQVMLNGLSGCYRNIPSVSVSGVCDDATKCALRVIQRCAHMEETGLPDRMTCCYLHELYCAAADSKESEKKDCIL